MTLSRRCSPKPWTRQATEHETVLFTFSGHGTYNHRLVAHDTSLADLADTTISMASLAERFRCSKARHILLVLDCYFSGGAPARVVEDQCNTCSMSKLLRFRCP